MSLNSTPSGERIHIAFFGMRNVGKSSLVNAVTGQELSLVSDVKGTTTDPVKKAMELLPLGPVVIIDTPGMDDEGALGEMRVKRARQILGQTDIAVLVTDGARDAAGKGDPSAETGAAPPEGYRRKERQSPEGQMPEPEKQTPEPERQMPELLPQEAELIRLFEERKIPYVIACNKSDLLAGKNRLPERPTQKNRRREEDSGCLFVSAKTGENIRELKELLGQFAKQWESRRRVLVADLLAPGDLVVLVVPIDASAPKGRLILPQQQVMRDILDAHGRFVTCQPEELKETLSMLAVRPKLVITDSQAFGRVSRDVPEDILLTSFSILFARYKGNLEDLVRGAGELARLQEGDRVLVSEGCTHHRQCNDIGTVKMPGWIEAFSGCHPAFAFTSGGEFPEDLSGVRLVVHCGGCMLNETEMGRRLRQAKAVGVPVVNYGIAIAHMHGILRRSLEPFPETLSVLDEERNEPR